MANQQGFTIAQSISDLQTIEHMARLIVPEVYGAYVPLYHCQYFIEQFQLVSALEKQMQQGYTYFLLHSDGINYGYFAYVVQVDRVRLSKLYLLKEARGKGLGQLAMDQTIKFTLDMGLQHIDLMVNRQNNSAIAFYQKNGFIIAESIETDFGNGTLVHDYRMEKKWKGRLR